MKYTVKLILFLLITAYLYAQDSSQTFLSLKTTGVEDFLKANPTYDGRGTIIFILDSGVDMGIEGLQKTSTGETKVIDVRDFTGEGDVKLTEAELRTENDTTIAEDVQNKLSVKGINKLEYKAVDDKYLIGDFDEERFRNSNSGVNDLNGNGRTNDNFIAVIFKAVTEKDTFWVAYIDTNDDGNLSDEKPLRSYYINQDTFQISNPKRLPYFTFAINIFPDEKLLSVFYDDDTHGTHCAGIAAGYRIGNQNLNGVAPGAKIIALKIGDNTNSGGATVTGSMRKAYLYADKISKERKEPCIVSMSCGVGSAIEGLSDMELFLDKLLQDNPYLYVCVSNGNDGPGISTAGLPACSKYVFSSGAVLAEDVGRDDYGASLKENIILHFSSRGGEAAKPDICSPGAATSTVTNFSYGDRFWGTSMASPYSAGIMSLMLSAVNQIYAGIKIPSQLLFKAVKEGAVKMEGYTVLDQGAGYINALNAYSVLTTFINNKEYENYQDYNVNSFAPNMPKSKAQNFYLRNGSLIDKNDVFRFTISRVNPDFKEKFYRIYNLVSDNDWLVPIQRKTYIRNNQTAHVSIRFDRSKMKEPGLYAGKISAYRADKTKFPEFDLIAAVVIPYEFNSSNNYSMQWDNEKLIPGELKRYFLNIPPDAELMTVKIKSGKNNYTNVIYQLFDPDGVNVFTSHVLYADKAENSFENYHSNLEPGVYELDVRGNYLATSESEYNLNIEFSGVKQENERITLEPVESKLKIFNYFNEIKSYDLSGSILGYQKEFIASLISSDRYVYPFMIYKNEDYTDFSVSMSKEDYNKFTDFSLQILDEKGNALVKTGLNYPSGNIEVPNSFENADSTKLFLILIPAFVDKPGNADINILEKTFLKNSISITVQNEISNNVEIYPTLEKTITCYGANANFYYPKDSKPFGKIYFNVPKTDKTEFEIPFLLNVEGDTK
jgi:tripeptidyl-peptidase-2